MMHTNLKGKANLPCTLLTATMWPDLLFIMLGSNAVTEQFDYSITSYYIVNKETVQY